MDEDLQDFNAQSNKEDKEILRKHYRVIVNNKFLRTSKVLLRLLLIITTRRYQLRIHTLRTILTTFMSILTFPITRTVMIRQLWRRFYQWTTKRTRIRSLFRWQNNVQETYKLTQLDLSTYLFTLLIIVMITIVMYIMIRARGNTTFGKIMFQNLKRTWTFVIFPTTLTFITQTFLITVLRTVFLKLSIHSTNRRYVKRRLMRKTYNLAIRRKWKQLIMMLLMITITFVLHITIFSGHMRRVKMIIFTNHI